MEKKKGTIRKQIMRPLIVFMVILTMVNAIVLGALFTNYYLQEQHTDATRVAQYCAGEFETYKSIDWIFDYWTYHGNEMELFYSDEKIINEKTGRFRQLEPEVEELESVTDEQAASMSEEGQKLFAELVYSRMSGIFDRLKESHRPLYLYSFFLKGDDVYIFVTGTKDDELRKSQGGELFELGTCIPYREGMYPSIDEMLRTGKSARNMEIPRGQGADRSVIHSFEPVYAGDELKAIVGVSFRSAEMISNGIRMMWVVFLITVGFFVLMVIVAFHNLKKIVIDPIGKEKSVIETYEKDKDSLTAARGLALIDSNNEIESMAESFSSMVTELDRYIAEVSTMTAEKERISTELELARAIQETSLPNEFPAFPDRHEFDIYASITPAKEVGGDLYNFFLIDDDHLALVIGDVSGKGIPASLFMMMTNMLINTRTGMGGSPSEILEYVNDVLCRQNKMEMFVTVWIAILEISTGKGIAANAGHEHPAIRRAQGQWELVTYKHSPAVATMEGLRFRQHEFELHPGDCLFVYTDGVTEATDSDDELFDTERMLRALDACDSHDPREFLASVKSGIDTFVGGAPQFDDITMMGLYYAGDMK